METQLQSLREDALASLEAITNMESLNEWRVQYLGRKSSLNQILRSLKELPPDERQKNGALANQIKNLLENKLQEKTGQIEELTLKDSLKQQTLDVTLPGKPIDIGRLHPLTQTIREICNIFGSMGFETIEGPEIEQDYYNFEALNIPEDHPARDMFATMWTDYRVGDDPNNLLLRTHTSPMQIRIMEKRRPPIRVIVPGRVYRYEASDATHESMFHQIEGLAVSENITLAELKGTLFEFASRLFGSNRKARFRCDYFPFVEPGVEMAIECIVCNGAGCSLCHNTGWIEILGGGMVHPNVLKRVGYDPAVYSGFAFGMGIERIPMLKYGIEDIRLFCGNDMRFLRQF